MTKRSREHRVPTALTVRARLEQGEPDTTICFLRDLSLSGACLSFADGTAVPEQFELFLEHSGNGYRVETAWQRANMVGVRFLEPLQAVAHEEVERCYRSLRQVQRAHVVDTFMNGQA